MQDEYRLLHWNGLNIDGVICLLCDDDRQKHKVYSFLTNPHEFNKIRSVPFSSTLLVHYKFINILTSIHFLCMSRQPLLYEND